MLRKVLVTLAASWVAAYAHHQLESSIMSELILKSGPTLLWRRQEYDSVTDEEHYIDLDVTSVAHEYLFESATIDPDVLLSDILSYSTQQPY